MDDRAIYAQTLSPNANIMTYQERGQLNKEEFRIWRALPLHCPLEKDSCSKSSIGRILMNALETNIKTTMSLTHIVCLGFSTGIVNEVKRELTFNFIDPTVDKRKRIIITALIHQYTGKCLIFCLDDHTQNRETVYHLMGEVATSIAEFG